MALLGFLMVSTWRYRSFKDLNLMRPRSWTMVIFLGSLIFLMWNYPQVMLLTIGVLYVGSGLAVRMGGIAKRLLRRAEAA